MNPFAVVIHTWQQALGWAIVSGCASFTGAYIVGYIRAYRRIKRERRGGR